MGFAYFLWHILLTINQGNLDGCHYDAKDYAFDGYVKSDHCLPQYPWHLVS